MTMTPRTLNADTIKECADGTICENNSPCLAHPTKEGAYMCDCIKATDSNKNSLIKFAGPYCEHQATSYCQSGTSSSEHAFCTNGGECKRLVTKTEEHAGCKCPIGYEGDFCQFIEGSKPSDWELSNYMHPSLASVYGENQDHQAIVLLALMILFLTSFIMICLFAICYVYLPSLKDKATDMLSKDEREMDSMSGVPPSAGVTGASNVSFVGGKSVYKKKNSTAMFVTADTLEADGGVLTAALGGLGGTPKSATMEESTGLEDIDVSQSTSLEEVDLDGEPSSKLREMV
mmetsp:Transcript_2972/g.5283  ORF Transcript_2972/g.5283 Transcript_2972/m.5283 type:complete len:289 (+) Transcript_2972:221-1087(+)|eukprot:CAMPEP_0201604394 /NCGR_PEP_ID=MMETSP0492-20130828/4555_1 /ASSEMBLY_ACC=CAM_ASM_000837 /TAXON_ID=420259 /ORGANISM="Thalassiosira gravida, Strain GMp14c1" /LENGTH=288 /DNA_ID=CAMNT_0048068417 /DNA_START=40 /DNA_END=906 /DNA_ORIENTATION=+